MYGVSRMKNRLKNDDGKFKTLEKNDKIAEKYANYLN